MTNVKFKLLMVAVLVFASSCGQVPVVSPATDTQTVGESTDASTEGVVLQQGVLGGMDLNRFCDSKYGNTLFFSDARLRQFNVYGWKCAVYTFVSRWHLWDNSIDTNEVCRQQYGNGAASAFRRYSDPYSWYCYR